MADDNYWNFEAEKRYLDKLGYWTNRRNPMNRRELLKLYIDTVGNKQNSIAPWKKKAKEYAKELLKEEGK